MVALVKEEIERALDGWKTRRKLGGSRDVEQSLRFREHFPGARYPLLDRRMSADECARDFIDTEATQDV